MAMKSSGMLSAALTQKRCVRSRSRRSTACRHARPPRRPAPDRRSCRRQDRSPSNELRAHEQHERGWIPIDGCEFAWKPIAARQGTYAQLQMPVARNIVNIAQRELADAKLLVLPWIAFREQFVLVGALGAPENGMRAREPDRGFEQKSVGRVAMV